MTNTRLFILITLIAISPLRLIAAIDMQAHVGSDEGKAAYTDYQAKQTAYYTGSYAYATLITLTNDALFGALNERMGNPCRLNQSGYNYDNLRDNYKTVDRDLNTSGYIIGYYNGQSIKGVWDSGSTWNREHTWPQSKGADSGIDMGHDMQSVRPASKSVNSSRGNTAYGESGSYYDPNEIAISNGNYKTTNLGTYRGDAARVIMYDYLMYGEAGGHKNSYHNGNAQLLSKLGSSGVFESLHIMLKWHMQDPPSLTEMVRNDGAQDYQGNRNPLIDYPELAIQVFLDDGITTYTVTESSAATMWPAHRYTLSDGFISYLTNGDGSHPADINVTGATYTYDASLGRLTVSKVTGNMTISDVAASEPEPEPDPTYTLTWNANGGILTGTYTHGQVAAGTPIVAPTATRSGYTFLNWLPAVAATMPAANTTYIAQWEKIAVVESFVVQWVMDGSVYATATYNTDGSETIIVPADPTPCDGYTFVGWTTQANYTNPFCPPSVLLTQDSDLHNVESDLTYYAVFKKDN